MGEGSWSPQFYPCHHLAKRAGSVHGGREQVTTFLALSSFSKEGWASSWGKGVGHHNFSLVTIQHRGLGQFIGEGSRSPQFYPCHHLAKRAGSVHGGREQVTTILHLSPFSTEVWASFMGEGGRSPHIYPCHHLAQRAGLARGGTEQVTTFLPCHRIGQRAWHFTKGGSRSPHSLLCHP